MAKKERFVNTPIDRTPYAGCAWVALISGALFLVGVAALWSLGSYVQHRTWHASFGSLPSLPSSDQSLGDQVEQAATKSQAALKQAADDQKQKAEDAAKAEAKKQAEAQVDAATQSATDNIKSYLSH